MGLGLLIAAHEAGHLVLARLTGMRVETYSLGFGPRIAGFKHGGHGRYRLSALPLGGSIANRRIHPRRSRCADASTRARTSNKPAWKRFLVIAAGPGA